MFKIKYLGINLSSVQFYAEKQQNNFKENIVRIDKNKCENFYEQGWEGIKENIWICETELRILNLIISYTIYCFSIKMQKC